MSKLCCGKIDRFFSAYVKMKIDEKRTVELNTSPPGCEDTCYSSVEHTPTLTHITHTNTCPFIGCEEEVLKMPPPLLFSSKHKLKF